MAAGFSLDLPNGGSAPLADVPRVRFEVFRDVVAGSPEARLASLFGFPGENGMVLVAILARDAQRMLSVTSTTVALSYPSLTPACPQAHLFEREIAEQWGVRPEGHPWLKPLRFPEAGIAPGVMPFFQVGGDEVHEVMVGPVHAGVIEPGHFRFQCHGERVIHLEISLGYQHRGIERALTGGPDKRTVHYVECAAGDTAAGHATAYGQIVDALAGAGPSPRGFALRAVALELERLANHAGDLGALAADVGYLPAAAFCTRLRGDFLNLTLLACGNRMGMGWVRPGGSAVDLDTGAARLVAERVTRAVVELERSFNLIRKNSTVRARLEDAGPLSREVCEVLGVVGLPARACGIARDVRRDFPLGAYAAHEFPVAVWPSGDVFARARVRWLECASSAAFLRELLLALPPGPPRIKSGPLPPDHIAVSLVEGWRGEICHVAVTDSRGRFRRYKIVDPSFHNWWALAMAMRGEPISDFPVCNKSFNLSYSGHDL